MARWQPPTWAVSPTSPGTLFLDVIKDGEVVESGCIDRQSHYIMGRNTAVVDLPTDHPSCSRQHTAILHRADGAILLVDLDSAHGTFFSDTQLKPNVPVEIKVGDSFRIGQSTRSYVVRREKTEGGSGQKRPRSPDASGGTFGKAVIEPPLSSSGGGFGKAVIQPAKQTPQDIQAAAAAYVRAHMGVSCMTADEKKKMLWGGKKVADENPKAAGGAGYNRWDAAEFNDSGQQEKFRKLMGVKGDGSGSSADVPTSGTVMDLKHQQQLQEELDKQFHEGRRHQIGGSFGLGR